MTAAPPLRTAFRPHPLPSGPAGSARGDDGTPSCILLDGDSPQGLQLRAALMAHGVDVYLGPHGVPGMPAPMVVVHAEHRHRPDVLARLDMARRAFPQARTGFVTGSVVADQWDGGGCDCVPGALRAAGFGYVLDESEAS
ncbi:MAG: hypothetical protein Q8K20_01465 [Gemmobacter sp.]|nr:hypothetical protein [Gemmobacter sp.]